MNYLMFLAAVSGFMPSSLIDEVKEIEKSLKVAILTGAKKDTEAAAQKLVEINTAAAAQSLCGILKPFQRPVPNMDLDWHQKVYWLLVRAIASLTDTAALETTGKFVLEHKTTALGRDLVTALHNNRAPGIEAVFVDILTKGPEDLKFLAVDHLTDIGGKACVPALIEELKTAKSIEYRQKLGRALSLIIGEDYGDSVSNWEGWWNANKDKDWQPRQRRGGSSTGTVTDSLDPSRNTEWDDLKKEAKILILQAGTKCCGESHDLDHIDQIASRMQVTYDTVDKADLEKKEIDLKPYLAILGNCTHIREHCDKVFCPDCTPGSSSRGDRLHDCACPKNKHKPTRYVLTEKGIAKLKAYVEAGGYLFAEDWCLEDYVGRMFPDVITHGGVRGEETIPVLPELGMSSHPYLRRIFTKPPTDSTGTMSESDLETLNHTWKIDDQTRTIKIKDPKRVTILLMSPDLQKYAQGDRAVAITFAAGREADRAPVTTGPAQHRTEMKGGRVLYVISHFGKQKSQDDEYTLQNLLVNFLIEANERRVPRK